MRALGIGQRKIYPAGHQHSPTPGKACRCLFNQILRKALKPRPPGERPHILPNCFSGRFAQAGGLETVEEVASGFVEQTVVHLHEPGFRPEGESASVGDHRNVSFFSNPLYQFDQHIAHNAAIFQTPFFQNLLICFRQRVGIWRVRYGTPEPVLEFFLTAVAIAQVRSRSRVGVVGDSRVSVKAVDLVISDQLFDKTGDGIPVGRIPANVAVQPTAMVKTSCSRDSACRMVKPLRMIHHDIVVRDDVGKRNVGDYTNALRMGFFNHLLNQIASIQPGVGWPMIVGEHRPFARTTDSNCVGVVVLHCLDDLTGIKGDVRPEGGVIIVHQEYPCPPDPLVFTFHKIQMPHIFWSSTREKLFPRR